LITGSNADLTLPATIGKIALFETAVSVDVLAVETTPAFTINALGDTCTITIKVQVPIVI
jgi:hypothetical protein